MDERIRLALNNLGFNPPQTLLLDGGTEEERIEATHYWVSRCLCPHTDTTGKPCLVCPLCKQIASDKYADLLWYDGRISKTEDEKQSDSLIRALIVDNIRDLKKKLRDASRNQYRFAVFMGISIRSNESLNALLKLLEDPLPFTLFVLLAPQKEQLLPTLVSRSLCLTLPWPEYSRSKNISVWTEDLADFLENGQGFLEKITAKGAVDNAEADKILLDCQHALIRVLSGLKITDPHSEHLEQILSRLDTKKQLKLMQWLREAQEMLRASVTPSRVIEALAMRLNLQIQRT